MKYLVILMALLLPVMTKAEPMYGHWIYTIDEGSRTDHITSAIYSDTIKYTQGGITLQYPDGYFSVPPRVHVTVLSPDASAGSVLFSPVITENSTAETTIIVNKLVPGFFKHTLSEADSDEVTLFILVSEF